MTDSPKLRDAGKFCEQLQEKRRTQPCPGKQSNQARRGRGSSRPATSQQLTKNTSVQMMQQPNADKKVTRSKFRWAKRCLPSASPRTSSARCWMMSQCTKLAALQILFFSVSVLVWEQRVCAFAPCGSVLLGSGIPRSALVC